VETGQNSITLTIATREARPNPLDCNGGDSTPNWERRHPRVPFSRVDAFDGFPATRAQTPLSCGGKLDESSRSFLLPMLHSDMQIDLPFLSNDLPFSSHRRVNLVGVPSETQLFAESNATSRVEANWHLCRAPCRTSYTQGCKGPY
jgi:hypothetical protein